MITRYYQAKLLNHDRLETGEVWVENNSIISFQGKADAEIDVKNNILLPGFIDLQINGGFGIDFINSPEKIDEFSERLLETGTTSFLATIISSSPETYREILPLLNSKIGKTTGANLLGIHVEGPCLNLLQSKAHHIQHLKKCEDFSPEECYGSLEGIKIVTLAPELPGALEWIKILSNQGIIVSAGHSMATAEQMDWAIEKGVKMGTHLFNAMVPLNHRNPGLIGSILNHENFFYSVISDGIHLDPLFVKLAWKLQPNGLILVTDGMEALGMPEGTYRLGDRDIEVILKGAYIKNCVTLAGATLPMNHLIKNLMSFTNCSLLEAHKAASVNPAKLLNLYPKKGSLDVGADADFVILNNEWKSISSSLKARRI